MLMIIFVSCLLSWIFMSELCYFTFPLYSLVLLIFATTFLCLVLSVSYPHLQCIVTPFFIDELYCHIVASSDCQLIPLKFEKAHAHNCWVSRLSKVFALFTHTGCSSFAGMGSNSWLKRRSAVNWDGQVSSDNPWINKLFGQRLSYHCPCLRSLVAA